VKENERKIEAIGTNTKQYSYHLSGVIGKLAATRAVVGE